MNYKMTKRQETLFIQDISQLGWFDPFPYDQKSHDTFEFQELKEITDEIYQ